MQKLRLLPLCVLSLSIGLMTSCDSTTSSSAPTISQFESASFNEATDTLHANQYIDFYGKVTDDQGLKSWSLTVLDASSKVVYTATVPSISGTSVSFDLAGKSSTNLRITNDGTWGPTGQYTVRLTVTNSQGNSINADQKIFAVGTGGGNNGTNLTDAGAVDLGAQAVNGVGSFLSIEGAWSITSGQKTAADEDSVDVVFFANPSSSSGTAMFYSPAAAYAASLGNLGGWTIRHNTIIVSSSTALSTMEQVKALTDASSSHSVTVSSTGWYAVKLDSGKYGSIHVTSLSGSGNGATVTVEVFN